MEGRLDSKACAGSPVPGSGTDIRKPMTTLQASGYLRYNHQGNRSFWMRVKGSWERTQRRRQAEVNIEKKIKKIKLR